MKSIGRWLIGTMALAVLFWGLAELGSRQRALWLPWVWISIILVIPFALGLITRRVTAILAVPAAWLLTVYLWEVAHVDPYSDSPGPFGSMFLVFVWIGFLMVQLASGGLGLLAGRYARQLRKCKMAK